MKEFELFESPESARAPRGQQLLFPHSSRTVCEEIGLNWWAALKLRAAGWLSFDPEVSSALDESQEVELRFVGSLVSGGCDPSLLISLLGTLEKPYRYRGSKIYYDWSACRWRLLPERNVNPETVFSDWIEQLRADRDVDTLRSLASDIDDALSEIEPSESGQGQ